MNPEGGRVSLQNKVQFDITMYFCRHGRENKERMKKSTVSVQYNLKNDIEFVAKLEDEMTKNHRETDEPTHTNFMPGNKDDQMCPVCSFKIYLSHLDMADTKPSPKRQQGSQ